MTHPATQLDQNGCVILREQVDPTVIGCLIRDLDSSHKPNTIGAGLRDLLNLVPSIKILARSEHLLRALQSVGVNSTQCVRAIYFDKQRDANWKVACHQDLTIAVKRRIDVDGFSAWTMKAGIQHVQPPVEILENMVAVRVHLDDADEMNGCLRVIPGSHRHGRLNPEQIAELRRNVRETPCVVKKGDFLVMRPLLLHASSVAVEPTHRRVIHLEYCSSDLPGGLEWYED